MNLEQELRAIIRDVADFPKEGIIFKDLTTVLLYPDLTRKVIDALADALNEKPDAIAGIESRGFWFGTLLAQKLNVPFIPLRKKGKLPGATEAIAYALEYGTATIEIHKGHVKKGWKVMVHDDLLATGGTALAAAQLLEAQGASIHSFSFLVHLSFLDAGDLFKQMYPDVPLTALVSY